MRIIIDIDSDLDEPVNEMYITSDETGYIYVNDTSSKLQEMGQLSACSPFVQEAIVRLLEIYYKCGMDEGAGNSYC